jgi:hypothetical protein
MSGAEQVLVKNEGFWDKDVYEEAMESLAEFKRKGGRLDRESQAEYDKYLFNKVLGDREKRRRVGDATEDYLVGREEGEREKPWHTFQRWDREERARNRERSTTHEGETSRWHEDDFHGRTFDNYG